jgi:hypothetical protein
MISRANNEKLSDEALTTAFAEIVMAQEEGIAEGNTTNSRQQNRELLELRREIRRRGKAGQAIWLQLMRHENDHVRTWSAGAVLEFAPEEAEKVLEELNSSESGMVRLNAEMTLKQWREGVLRFDY